MTIVSSKHDVVEELMRAFGLDNKSIFAFNLNVMAGEVVNISVQFYAEDKMLGRIPSIVKRYHLTETESTDVTKES